MTSSCHRLIDLSFLSDAERDAILNVLDRDEQVRHHDEERISQLSAELRALRMRGILRPGHDGTRTCARCRKPFGRLFVNTGRVCFGCRHRICNECRRPLPNNSRRWLCVFCYKQMELDAMTGRWFQVATTLGVRPSELIPGSSIIRESMHFTRLPSTRSLHYTRSADGDHMTSSRLALSDDEYACTSHHHHLQPLRTRTLPTAAIFDRRRYDDVDAPDARRRTRSVESNDDVESISAPSSTTCWQPPSSRDYFDDYNDDVTKYATTTTTRSSTVASSSPVNDDDQYCVCDDDDGQTAAPAVCDVTHGENDDVIVSRRKADVEELPVVVTGNDDWSPTLRHDVIEGELEIFDMQRRTQRHTIGGAQVRRRGDAERRRVTEVCHRSVPSIFITDPTSPLASSSGMPGFNKAHDLSMSQKFASIKSASLTPLSASNESLVSTYSNTGGSLSSNNSLMSSGGEIEFGLAFNHVQSTLDVSIRQCRHLVINKTNDSPRVYVKTYLLPDKSKAGKRKTKVKRKTLNPVFNEVLKYHVTRTELNNRVLRVMVWNYERLARNNFLGEVNVPLDHRIFIDPVPKWYRLDGHASKECLTTNDRGDVTLRIRFELTNMAGVRTKAEVEGQLHVVVKRARCLTGVQANELSDPFCVCLLLPDRPMSSSSAVHKTSVIRQDLNPVWNETFAFDDLTLSSLADTRCLELTVWNSDRAAGHDFLGGLRLNLGTGKSGGEAVDWMDSAAVESDLWRAVLDQPDCWIEATLPLRSNMQKHQ